MEDSNNITGGNSPEKLLERTADRCEQNVRGLRRNQSKPQGTGFVAETQIQTPVQSNEGSRILAEKNFQCGPTDVNASTSNSTTLSFFHYYVKEATDSGKVLCLKALAEMMTHCQAYLICNTFQKSVWLCQELRINEVDCEILVRGKKIY
jgi:hypothetical protein